MLFFKKICIIIFLTFIPFPVFSQELIITEVQVRGENPNESYIKIFNESFRKKDISGFRLIKKSSTGREYSIRVFPSNSSVDPKGYFVWGNSRNDYHILIKADVSSTVTISSNNSIALLSPERLLIDSLSWGEGENQFALGNPFPFNPQEKEIIKRFKENGNYVNTRNNSKDFYIFPEKHHFEKEFKEEISILDKKSFFPLKEFLSISFFLSLIVVILKINLEKKQNGRT